NTRWSNEAVHDHELKTVHGREYVLRFRSLRAGNMDLWTDEDIKALVQEAKSCGLTFYAAFDAVLGQFFEASDDGAGLTAIPPDHWRAYRVKQLVMEVYQPRTPEEEEARIRPWDNYWLLLW